MILHLARVAPLLAALACWRVTRPAALALLGAFAASLLYLATKWEALRWVSAAAGLVGAIELGRDAREANSRLARERRQAKRYEALRRAALHGGGVPPKTPRIHLTRRGWIGLMLLASMGGDMGAMIAWRTIGEWVMPTAQIVVCLAIVAIARWPEMRS